MIKKTLFNGGLVTGIYILCVYFFESQKIIFPVFMITAFIASMYLTYKNVIASFLPLLIIWITHLFLPDSELNTVIIYIIFTPLTFLLGFYLRNKSYLLKIVYPFILLFIGLYGFVNLWYYMANYNAYKMNASPVMLFTSNRNDEIRLDTIQNKVIVLDYWTTRCGVCFKKFPDYDKLYLNYKDNSNVLIYAVNIPHKRDATGYAKSMIEKYNYQFPVLYSDSDTIPKQLGFHKYPHLIILKNGKVRYNGYPALGEDNLFVNSLKDEIELLLKE